MYRLPFADHKRADVISRTNKTAWSLETGYSQNVTPIDVPWRVTSDTMDNSVRLVFDLKNSHLLGEHCRESDSGLTVNMCHKPV